VGEVVHAYLVADHDTGAGAARQKISAKAKTAADEQAKLVALEDALEDATLQLLREEK